LTTLDWLNEKNRNLLSNSTKNFFKGKNLKADIHEISGSVEIAPGIGLADAICDLVSSGSTLFKNNLEEKEIIFKSHPSLSRSWYYSKRIRNHLSTINF